MVWTYRRKRARGLAWLGLAWLGQSPSGRIRKEGQKEICPAVLLCVARHCLVICRPLGAEGRGLAALRKLGRRCQASGRASTLCVSVSCVCVM